MNQVMLTISYRLVRARTDGRHTSLNIFFEIVETDSIVRQYKSYALMMGDSQIFWLTYPSRRKPIYFIASTGDTP